MRLVLVGVALLAALFVAKGEEIYEAETVVTYQRGFDTDRPFKRPLSNREVEAVLSDTRQVVVSEQGLAFDSFLQEEEEEDEHVVKYHSQVSNTVSQFRECGKCTSTSTPECRACMQDVMMSAGPLHFHVIKTLHRQSLIRSVKVGFTPIAPWTTKYPHGKNGLPKRLPDEVYHTVVPFPDDGVEFVTRPIVLASVLPDCDGGNNCDKGWTDVFAVSLSAITTQEFAVNIMRVDSAPNNTWGQRLRIAWIAFEPNDSKAFQADQKASVNEAHVTLHA